MAYPRPNVTPISRGMPHLDLSDDEAAALAKLLTRTIADDRYPLSPRIQTLRGRSAGCWASPKTGSRWTR
jgi:hypothetical protein